ARPAARPVRLGDRVGPRGAARLGDLDGDSRAGKGPRTPRGAPARGGEGSAGPAGRGGAPCATKDTGAAGGPPRPARRSAAPSYPVPGGPGRRSDFTREGYFEPLRRVIAY